MQSQHTIWSLDDRLIINNYIHGSYSFWNEWGSIIIKSRTLCQVDLIFIRLIHSTRHSSSIILSTTQWILHPLIIFARQRRATNDPAHCPQSIDLFAARYNTQRATGGDRRRPGVIELFCGLPLSWGSYHIHVYCHCFTVVVVLVFTIIYSTHMSGGWVVSVLDTAIIYLHICRPNTKYHQELIHNIYCNLFAELLYGIQHMDRGGCTCRRPTHR